MKIGIESRNAQPDFFSLRRIWERRKGWIIPISQFSPTCIPVKPRHLDALREVAHRLEEVLLFTVFEEFVKFVKFVERINVVFLPGNGFWSSPCLGGLASLDSSCRRGLSSTRSGSRIGHVDRCPPALERSSQSPSERELIAFKSSLVHVQVKRKAVGEQRVYLLVHCSPGVGGIVLRHERASCTSPARLEAL